MNQYDIIIIETGAGGSTLVYLLADSGKKILISKDFFITSEDLPHKDNRVTLTENGDIKLEYTQNNLEAYQRLRKKLVGMMDGIGCEKGYCKDTA